MSVSTTTGEVTFPAPLLPTNWSVADVQSHLGGVPATRIRSYPPPGMATEEDALRLQESEGVLCELVDGVLLEKTVGAYESFLAAELIFWLRSYLRDHPIGFMMAPDGPVRPRPNKMRIAESVCEAWHRLPGRCVIGERRGVSPTCNGPASVEPCESCGKYDLCNKPGTPAGLN